MEVESKTKEKIEESKKEKNNITINLKNNTDKLVMKLIILLLVCCIGILGMKLYEIKKDAENQKTMITTKVEFENIGQLVTQTANVTVVKNYRDSREFLKLFDIPFTEYVLIFSYDVNIDAYVDFTKIHYTEKDNKFIVELPHAEYKEPSIVKGSKIKYYDNKNIFNSIDFDKSDEIREEMEDKALNDALKNGLLEKAEKNAEQVISNMLKSDESHKDFDVEFNYIGG